MRTASSRSAPSSTYPCRGHSSPTLAAAAQLVEQTERLEGHTASLNNAVIEALLGGSGDEVQDLAQDAEVQKLAILRTVGTSGVRAAGADKAARMIEQLLGEFADTIIGQLIDAVHDDCTHLSDSVSALGDIEDLRTIDAASVSRTGRLAVWQAALNALDRITTAHEGQRTLIAAVGVPVGRQHMALALADADIDELDRINTRAANPKPWTVVKVTGSLDLADITALRTRIDRCEAFLAASPA